MTGCGNDIPVKACGPGDVNFNSACLLPGCRISFPEPFRSCILSVDPGLQLKDNETRQTWYLYGEDGNISGETKSKMSFETVDAFSTKLYPELVLVQKQQTSTKAAKESCIANGQQ